MPPCEPKEVFAIGSLIVKTNKSITVLNGVQIVILVEVLVSVWKATVAVVFVFFFDILGAIVVVLLSVRVTAQFFLCGHFVTAIASSVCVSFKDINLASMSPFFEIEKKFNPCGENE